MKPFHRNSSSRSGVALITVLGILGTLTLLALAFTILTRTERAASRNAMARSDARHYIDAALNFAVVHAVLFQSEAQGAMTYEELFDDIGIPSEDSDNNPIRRANCFGFHGDCDQDAPSVRLGRNSLTNWLPRAIWDEATNTWSFWLPVTATNQNSNVTVTNGRISYLVIDCSGFLDVHGVTTNHAAILSEYDFKSDVDFASLRDDGGTNRFGFLSHPDLNSRGGAWGFATPVSNLVTCLFDPDPDVTVTNWSNLGESNIGLVPKFNISPWKDDALKDSCLDFDDPIDIEYWLEEVTNRLAVCGYADDESLAIAWNILNFIDPDRTPQAWDENGDEIETPWRQCWPIEDVPLINELSLIDDDPTQTNAVDAIPVWNGDSEGRLFPDTLTNYSYRIATELWYPFAPRPIEEIDNAGLSVCVCTNGTTNCDIDWNSDDQSPTNELGEVIGIRFGCESDPDKDEMRGFEFDPEDEDKWFIAITNPIPSQAGIVFPIDDYAVSNEWEVTIIDPDTDEETTIITSCWERATMYAPIGTFVYPRFTGATTPPITNATATHTLSPIARVTIDGGNSYTNWVDEAPGYANLLVFNGDTNSWSAYIDDPRHNHDSAEWHWAAKGDDTLGTTNTDCTAWSGITENGISYGQGLPLIHFDAPLRTAGDIGFIASTGLWQSVCLLDPRWQGGNNDYAVFTHGSVLDFFTVHSTNRPTCGLMSYNTPWTNVIRAVMADIPISESRSSTNLVSAIETDDGENLVKWMTDCYLEARDQYITVDGESSDTHVCPTTIGELAYFLGQLTMFNEGPDVNYGEFATSDLWQPATNRLDDVLKEDIIRGLAERISFRQRLYVIVLAAQSLAPNGRIAADQRAVVTIASDLFTGNWRILNWAWLE